MTDSPVRLAAALADRYTIERELGQGGMATVYLAHDIKHDRHVALKVLHPDLAATIGVDRFLSEIKVTANLQHPNILGLFDSGVADGQAYYVMPYVEGESLRDRLTREKQLPVADALRIATGVAAALEYAHVHGVIHRDIKPENILLQSGQPVVADFGIALAVQQAGGQRLTQTGMSLGTPQYMSPEQAMGERTLDARTDIYALGVITYEMLAGEPPFSGPNTQAIVARVLTEKPRPLAQLRDTVSPPVEAAVHQAMQKLPADRFATAAIFAEALRAGGGSSAQFATVGRNAPPTSPGRRLVIPVVMIAALMLAAGYLVGKRSSSSAGPATEWQGELLGGPEIAMVPTVSRDGQPVAFQAMVDGQTQLGVLKPESGDWRVLTSDRSRGLVGTFSWARDNSRIYFDRSLDVPTGVFSISPLGSDERLVLADAGQPDVLPDGSLLVVRLNSNRDLQLLHFWPESGRLDTLGAIGDNSNLQNFFRAFPDGKEAVFFGRPASQRDSANHLYTIDLTSHRTRRLAPDSNLSASAIATTPDDGWVIVTSNSKALQRITAVARDGSNRTRNLATLTLPIYGLSVGTDESLYFDQYVRPRQLIRMSLSDRKMQSQPIPSLTGTTSLTLPLPDGRVLMSVLTGSGSRVMVMAPGKDPAPFMGTVEQTGAPLALLGSNQVALMLGTGKTRSIAIASVATGQLVRRLPGIATGSLAGSPDGKTIYYAMSGSIWAVSSSGGEPRKIRSGDGVAADPGGRYLLIEVDDTNGVRLLHVPLDGTVEREITVQGDTRIAPGVQISSNAVGADGRIVVQVAPPASWFWPVAILDPASGKLDILPPAETNDMRGGWSADGHVVYTAYGLQAKMWRFRPVTAKDAKP